MPNFSSKCGLKNIDLDKIDVTSHQIHHKTGRFGLVFIQKYINLFGYTGGIDEKYSNSAHLS